MNPTLSILNHSMVILNHSIIIILTHSMAILTHSIVTYFTHSIIILTRSMVKFSIIQRSSLVFTQLLHTWFLFRSSIRTALFTISTFRRTALFSISTFRSISLTVSRLSNIFLVFIISDLGTNLFLRRYVIISSLTDILLHTMIRISIRAVPLTSCGLCNVLLVSSGNSSVSRFSYILLTPSVFVSVSRFSHILLTPSVFVSVSRFSHILLTPSVFVSVSSLFPIDKFFQFTLFIIILLLLFIITEWKLKAAPSARLTTA
uniref:Uncharacterized protein n=2 Tax=Cacopsylla melanoneura TaxID=428564 RepID=A0A8D9B5S8_9HEMI